MRILERINYWLAIIAILVLTLNWIVHSMEYSRLKDTCKESGTITLDNIKYHCLQIRK